MNTSVIEEQITGVSFDDDRLRQRYELSLSRIQTRDWSQSFPSLIKDSYELKGFYRFINNTRIDQSTFIKGYVKGLISYNSKQLSEQGDKLF